jgi:hypothetical protein
MSIMRRGPLDRYLPAWVLRQAVAHGLDGSITFEQAVPTTFFLDDGSLYAAAEGADPNPEEADGDPPDEATARAQLVRLLVDVQCRTGGTYVYEPFGHHPACGLWRWDVEDLLAASRTASSEVTAAAIYGHQRLAVRADGAGTGGLDPDARAVLATLADTATTEEVRTELGWEPSRLLGALMKLHRAELLDAVEEPQPEIPDDAGPAPSATAKPPPAIHKVLASAAGQSDAEHDAAPDGAPEPADRPGPSPAGTEERAAGDGRQDFGVGDNAPANHALRAWLEHQIPEVHTGPLEATAWAPAPEPPPRRSLRQALRSALPGAHADRPDHQG